MTMNKELLMNANEKMNSEFNTSVTFSNSTISYTVQYLDTLNYAEQFNTLNLDCPFPKLQDTFK